MMIEFDLSPLDIQVLAALRDGFPVSQSPYCDIAEELGASEIDVLNSAEQLRQTSALECIAVVFPDMESVLRAASPQDVDLIELVSVDLPWGEHPYAEVAAQLQLRGVQLEEADVLARIRKWIAQGSATGVRAQPRFSRV